MEPAKAENARETPMGSFSIIDNSAKIATISKKIVASDTLSKSF
jgi:hypothetical protein